MIFLTAMASETAGVILRLVKSKFIVVQSNPGKSHRANYFAHCDNIATAAEQHEASPVSADRVRSDTSSGEDPHVGVCRPVV